MTKFKLPVFIGLLIANMCCNPMVFSQQIKNQFVVHAGIGKSIVADNPYAGNLGFGYEYIPFRKYDFFSVEPRAYSSMIISKKVDPIERWNSDCVSYGLGLALAPRLTLSMDDFIFLLYCEYEISVFNYFSVVNVQRESLPDFSAKSNRNVFVHSRWRCGLTTPRLLKDVKHKMGIGVWAGFTSIRHDKIIQQVIPSQFDKYFLNLPLDGEFGISFYF